MTTQQKAQKRAVPLNFECNASERKKPLPTTCKQLKPNTSAKKNNSTQSKNVQTSPDKMKKNLSQFENMKVEELKKHI